MQKEKITINNYPIELDKFLKIANAVTSGGMVKELIIAKKIKRNGELETARRRKLNKGDIIEVKEIGIFELE